MIGTQSQPWYWRLWECVEWLVEMPGRLSCARQGFGGGVLHLWLWPPIVLLPMPLLQCCHTSMQCGCVPDLQTVQVQSTGGVALSFQDLNL